MSDKYKTQTDKLYYVTITVVGWIDVFTRKEYVYDIMKNLTFCQKNKGLEIYAFVIMSNHIHLIAKSSKQPLNILLGDFKSYTAKQIINQIRNNSSESRKEWLMHMFKFYGNKNGQNTEFQFWQNGNHAIELWSPEVIKQKINYLHNNPVKQGIVTYPQDYIYSSASEFSEIKVLKL